MHHVGFALFTQMRWVRLNKDPIHSSRSETVISSNDEEATGASRAGTVPKRRIGIATGMALAAIALTGMGTVTAHDGAKMPGAQPVSLPSDLIRPTVGTIMDLAKARPIAAVALLSIIQNKQSPLSDETTGNSILLPSIPTSETAKKMLAHADEALVVNSMAPLSSNFYSFLMISWNQSLLPDGEVMLRFSAQLVDAMGRPYDPPQPMEAQTTVALRKGDTGLLTWVRE
jgi:hypothetical protein